MKYRDHLDNQKVTNPIDHSDNFIISLITVCRHIQLR